MIAHLYGQAGVYTLKATLTDPAGTSAQAICQYVVVYDPNGWISSPSGAYSKAPTLRGARVTRLHQKQYHSLVKP